MSEALEDHVLNGLHDLCLMSAFLSSDILHCEEQALPPLPFDGSYGDKMLELIFKFGVAGEQGAILLLHKSLSFRKGIRGSEKRTTDWLLSLITIVITDGAILLEGFFPVFHQKLQVFVQIREIRRH